MITSKRVITSLITCLTVHLSIAQFEPNSIGVAYLRSETTDSVFLEIAVPAEMLKKDSTYAEQYPLKTAIDSFYYAGQIMLFDMAGEAYKINKRSKFLMSFWCDNDGGVQYRPTLYVSIKKGSLKHQLKGIDQIQDICCFVLLNQSKSKMDKPDYSVSNDIRLKGDYNADGSADCFIWTEADSAGNCDGTPANNLDITLQVGKKSFALRCCGP
jgi:hypothetical protein